jgi:hypothetical protein
MAVTIVPSTLRQQVEEGWKLKALAEHYDLPDAQMKKALKALNLTIRKFHAPKFVFAEEKTTEEINHTITQGDLDNNPELLEHDVIVGDEITLLEQTENTIEENVETPTEEINTTTTTQPAVSQMGDW